MVKVKLDGVEVEVEPGTTVLEAAKKAGIEIPHLCTLKDLYNGASCRLCLVKTARGKLAPACAYQVYRDEEFTVNSLELKRIRKVNFELLLSFHKIECWKCERKGDCILARLSQELGVEGIPVCSQCPLPPEECLLTKGILCLGMITSSGCDAECITSGGQCWGCRGPITRRDVLKRAFKRYEELGFNIDDVLFRAEIFWNSVPAFEKLKKVAAEVRGGKK